MILVFILWIFTFTIFYVIGFSAVRFIERLWPKPENAHHFETDEHFFMGFLVLSIIAGILSIFIPVGTHALLGVCLLAMVLFFLQLKEFKARIGSAIVAIRNISRRDLFIYLLVTLFILMALSHPIRLWDTELYHAQYIKWIRTYAVVPGLGNIHGRFAFNSMFFVVSGLFTFEIGDTLIYPLNGVCLLALAYKLIKLFLNNSESLWKSVFYGSLLLVFFALVLRSINSPSPDIICAVLIVFAFLYMLDFDKIKVFGIVHFTLLCLLVFSCITYKLSSAFIVLLLIPALRFNFRKGLWVLVIAGIMVFIPFLLRNYYLSGYLVYPFPSVDVFDVDWKIPITNVIDEKQWIESWARIPGLPPEEVLNLKFTEWIRPWLGWIGGFERVVIAVNALLVLVFAFAIVKKDRIFLGLIAIVLVNLTFWFTNAPAPRFAYGFLILGFSFAIALPIKLLSLSSAKVLTDRHSLLLIIMFAISFRYFSYPIKNPKAVILPGPFGKAEVENRNEQFQYKHSLSDSRCYNAELPCTPYPLENVEMRGDDLADGFRIAHKCLNNTP